MPQGSSGPLWLYFFGALALLEEDSVLDIPAAIFDGMIEHARAQLPNECCGLPAGKGGVILQRYALRNELMSPVVYRANTRDLFVAVREMREHELDLIAI